MPGDGGILHIGQAPLSQPFAAASLGTILQRSAREKAIEDHLPHMIPGEGAFQGVGNEFAAGAHHRDVELCRRRGILSKQ